MFGWLICVRPQCLWLPNRRFGMCAWHLHRFRYYIHLEPHIVGDWDGFLWLAKNEKKPSARSKQEQIKDRMNLPFADNLSCPYSLQRPTQLLLSNVSSSRGAYHHSFSTDAPSPLGIVILFDLGTSCNIRNCYLYNPSLPRTSAKQLGTHHAPRNHLPLGPCL